MKKLLMPLMAAGVLAVPVGVTMAQEDTTDPMEPVPTCEDREQVRDRDRVNEQTPVGEQGQKRAQHQFQVQDGNCDMGCTGDQARDRLEDRTADQAQSDQNGPAHRATRDGAGRGNG